MTKAKKSILGLGVLASVLAIYYLGTGLVFYIRLHAAGLQQWDLDGPDLWAVCMFVAMILSAVMCIYCLLPLIHESSRRNRDKENAT